MSVAEDQRKDALIDAIVADLGAGDHAQLGRVFARRLFERVPGDELLARSQAQLTALATDFLNFACHRPAGQLRLRVFNPSHTEHGWDSAYTVIEMINDDGPFLVDSVVLALSELNLSAHLIMHPVINVQRDAKGQLLNLGERDSDWPSESMMHVQIDRQYSQEALKKVTQTIERALDELRFAVQDWQAMVKQTQRIASRLPETHAHLDADLRAELADFFAWLMDDHFTFLGYREYRIEGQGEDRVLAAVAESGLGILHPDRVDAPVRTLKSLRRAGDPRSVASPIIITKTNAPSRVHRGGYMDYISVLYVNEAGRVIREKRLIGLFTSNAYIRRCQDTPLVRRKVKHVMSRSGLRPGSHASKALLHILETLPRDELFQASSEELLELGIGILDLQERSQTRLFVRRERFGRFYSCLVFIPRDRFNTENRERIQNILKRALGGQRLDFAIQVGESKLARVHVVVRPKALEPIDVDIEAIQNRIRQAIRSWSDELETQLIRLHGEREAQALTRRFGRAFPTSYTEEVAPGIACHDVAQLRQLNLDAEANDLRLSLYKPRRRRGGMVRLKLFKPGQPIPLSDVLPILENLGMRIVSERPHELRLADGHQVWIQDFDMEPVQGEDFNLDAVRQAFHLAFEKIWRRHCDNDGFNRLIPLAELDWRQVAMVRACCKYLLQTGLPFSQTYMEQTLSAWPMLARLLVEYFEARFDPARASLTAHQRERAQKQLEAQCQRLLSDHDDEVLREYIEEWVTARGQTDQQRVTEHVRRAIGRALEQVSSADQDRILRAFVGVVSAMLRTNFFQRDESGEWLDRISFKLDCSQVPELPQPRPYREIWVYSTRVEGIHLRGGPVARGGLRWSDRREDFRTEVLGLLRAQMVKNTMIVPVGAKGGFVVKRIDELEDRDAVQREVEACYCSFIQGLLDITDNLEDESVQPPDHTVRHDDDDPYLVVAADKGTATFSDLANSVSLKRNFWLGDAFASGGSNGYDHKKMAITARGAWESVKCHFRELGLDIRQHSFTVVGIGDMSGDVFGNGMLLSHQIKLRAAFNHQHIFLDPDPDPAKSFAERQRLFALPRSSWADYNSDLISKGGGVFSRQAKRIELSRPVREWLGIEETALTPQALIQALLCAEVDLLWNGGIGTYVKSKRESHTEVGDLANNAVRVNADALRCRVIGEGGNLGVTQLGRIEYALNGGRINTDFIDNSAGVDCSDHEVNIKILLDQAVKQDRLDLPARNALLASMTDEVAQLVLRSNVLQNRALSMMEALTSDRLGSEAHLIAMLDGQGVIDRDLEHLPDSDTLNERAAQGKGLTRPELSLLLSYSKIKLYQDLLASDVPEDAYLSRELSDYFPQPLQGPYADLMGQHRLKREIIATKVTNSIVNRMGAHFAMRIKEDTGANSATVAKAYTVAREVVHARLFWQQVEALDHDVPAAIQTEMMLEMWRLLRQLTRRLITQPQGHYIDISERVARFGAGLDAFTQCLPTILSGELAAQREAHQARLIEAEVPESLARQASLLPFMYSSLDLIDLAHQHDYSVEQVARTYFQLFNHLHLKWLRQQVERLPVELPWHAHARGNLRDQLFRHHQHLLHRILEAQDKSGTTSAEDAVRHWMNAHADEVARVGVMLEEMHQQNVCDYPSLQVAIAGLEQLLNATA